MFYEESIFSLFCTVVALLSFMLFDMFYQRLKIVRAITTVLATMVTKTLYFPTSYPLFLLLQL